jgi:hypothetical protein
MNFSGDGFSSWIEGQILMNTGDNIQNMALGANGYTIELISGTPVNNLQVTNVDFRGGGGMVNDAVDGVFTIDTGQTLTNSTFTNVTIETNSDGIGDGISMVTNGLPQSMLHDVTFQGLDIKSQPCMGFALDDRTYLGTPTTDNYNINIINSIIEPSGSESISIEGGNNLLIQGNTFMGSGTSSVYPWHQTLEFNGSTSAKAIGNTFYRSDSAWLNLHCTNCTFKSNVFDDTVNYINTPSVAHDQSGWGATCSGCTFQYNEMTMDTGGAFFYFSSSSNTNIIDNIFWDQRNPTIECGIYLYYGSTNINLTGNTFYNKYKWYSDYSTCINLYEDSTINSSNNTYLSPTAITSLPPVHAP